MYTQYNAIQKFGLVTLQTSACLYKIHSRICYKSCSMRWYIEVAHTSTIDCIYRRLVGDNLRRLYLVSNLVRVWEPFERLKWRFEDIRALICTVRISK